ncbi:RHS repeat-associated core domain-containing protein [Pseudomonas sp. LRF_L74]|uniref:RHS repeat-associated core domain-containing protein n=1 Tax=Pseudomonas sp. LRF_L74 TaxID=3369422 RepID=UPI003F613836
MKITYPASALALALAMVLGTGAHAAQRSWSYTYNSFGQVETADGPRTDVSDVTTYSYDGQGHLIQVTNALGHTTQLSNFTNLGHPKTVVDANSITSTLGYTAQGWLSSVTTDGRTTRFTHDAIGQIIKLTRADGSWLQYTWSDARRLVRITNNLGERVDYEYSVKGDRTSQKLRDSSGTLVQQQTWAYDELGRLLRAVGAVGQTSQYQYDLNDNQTAETNPRQNTYGSGYDALNRLISSTDPLGGVTGIGYDDLDNINQVTDPRGVITTYEYDGLGNLLRQNSPDTGLTTFTHDGAGNVTSKTDARGIVTTYSYDALNRLTGKQYPANQSLNVQYHYDMTGDGNKGIGRLTAVQDSSGVIGYHYDQYGDLTDQIRSVEINGIDQYETLSYGYDNAHQLTRIDYPAGFSVAYNRNAGGQVTGVDLSVGSAAATSLASDISYLPFGPVKSLTWGNGIALNRTYDKDYRLKTQMVGPWQSSYTFDANSNIRQIDHTLWGTVQYSYDVVDRLMKETTADQKKTYTYDGNDNRTRRNTYTVEDGTDTIAAKQILTYKSDSNRLDKNGSFQATVDAAGNVEQQTTGRKYRYDEQGRLQAVLDSTGKELSNYTYNALGQRTLKQLLSYSSSGPIPIATTFLYDPQGQIVGQVNYVTGSNKKKTAQYWVWLDDMPLASVNVKYAGNGTTISSTSVVYLHADHLNTPRLASGANQQLLWSWNSDAFGNGLPNQDVDGDGVVTDIPLRFPGQLYDGTTGLYYNYFRDYDPQTGRYVESDPIGLSGGTNTYGYVNSNPVNYTDNLGLFRGGARAATSNSALMPYVAPCLLCSAYTSYPAIGPEVRDSALAPKASLEGDGLPYPFWSPIGAESWPDRTEQDEAFKCEPNRSSCYELAISIDVLVRTINMRRDQMASYGGGDKGHKDRERNTRKVLSKLVREARARNCPYNPAANELIL